MRRENPFEELGRLQAENLQFTKYIFTTQAKMVSLQAVSFLLLFLVWRRVRRNDG